MYTWRIVSRRKNPLWKVVATDALGVLCLLLVPFFGPLPGPGGIPLLLAGFGLLAANHDWADNAIHYVKRHSESLQNVIFPNIAWVKWSWDIFVILLIIGGTWLNIAAGNWFWKAFSYGLLAGSTTIFMLNRNRLAWLDRQLRRTGKR